MNRDKWSIGMDPQQVIIDMCDGNPGAIDVMVRMLKKRQALGVPSFLLTLPIIRMASYGMRGGALYIGFKDVCNEDLDKFMRLVESGDKTFLDRSEMLWKEDDPARAGDLRVPEVPDPLVTQLESMEREWRLGREAYTKSEAQEFNDRTEVTLSLSGAHVQGLISASHAVQVATSILPEDHPLRAAAVNSQLPDLLKQLCAAAEKIVDAK